MTKAELESKSLAELHTLAAEAGIERYRMLSRAELIGKLAGGTDAPQGDAVEGASRRSQSSRRRRRGGRESAGDGRAEKREERPPTRRESKPREERPPARRESKPRQERRERESKPRAPERAEPAAPEPAAAPRPKRKRRRRRWGRRRKGVRVNDLLLPAEAGRQALVYAESREACTALLRGIAAELAAASNGPDPIALLVDPSPEELAEWRREAPQAEIVAAGKAQHADDAVAQAARRAAAGEHVFLLVDSLTRFAESFADADAARDLFDAGRRAVTSGNGSLTVVAALERP